MPPSNQSEHHHGSHRGLLHAASSERSAQAQVDAIIVPTIREPRTTAHAIDLAKKLGCVLVALCSGRHTSADAVADLATAEGAEILAVDTDNLPADLLPRFATGTQVPDAGSRRHTDISLKRNLGLLIARLADWERVVFLDDDIEVPDPLDLRRAAALTDEYAGVGLNIRGYPDNSVVCHAYREAGGAQDVFVGGGALAVHSAAMSSFFPDIYNDDWFFLLGGDGLRPTAVTGVAEQQVYDPFADDERARMEEFGDVLAEGLFWLLDEGRSLLDADVVYWRQYLAKRRRFIVETIDMVHATETDIELRARKLSSLRTALNRSQHIRPDWCETYVHLWRSDRNIWQRHLDRLEANGKQSSRRGDLDQVVLDLNLVVQSRYQPR
jgi:hypothetical protein